MKIRSSVMVLWLVVLLQGCGVVIIRIPPTAPLETPVAVTATATATATATPSRTPSITPSPVPTRTPLPTAFITPETVILPTFTPGPTSRPKCRVQATQRTLVRSDHIANATIINAVEQGEWAYPLRGYIYADVDDEWWYLDIPYRGWAKAGDWLPVYDVEACWDLPVERYEAPLPTNAPPPTPAAVTPVTSCTATVVVTSGLLNLRAGPGTNYPVIKQLANGDKAVFYERDGSWARIQPQITPYQMGWAHTSYLRFSPEGCDE